MATAIHAGHEIRAELLPLLALDEARRAQEEDPYTDYWVKIVPTWLVPRRSRFEVDLNREREEAVYLYPEMAWGLHLWKQCPDPVMIERSLAEYDAFYESLYKILQRIAAHYKHFVVFDLHAYNYRRNGPEQPPASAEDNPEVNIGTGTMDRVKFANVVERFMRDLRSFDYLGRHLDARENVKFKGRYLAKWIHDKFPGHACVISIEFKKIYMNEWTGVGDVEQILAIRNALQFTIPGILKELQKLEQ
ncbi:MAG: N-formylglutamate amidohydrolase [Burkholderiales bacterium]|nr:N-formylglutamate amidohydrolase [Burkholderiales bacterium]